MKAAVFSSFPWIECDPRRRRPRGWPCRSAVRVRRGHGPGRRTCVDLSRGIDLVLGAGRIFVPSATTALRSMRGAALRSFASALCPSNTGEEWRLDALVFATVFRFFSEPAVGGRAHWMSALRGVEVSSACAAVPLVVATPTVPVQPRQYSAGKEIRALPVAHHEATIRADPRKSRKHFGAEDRVPRLISSENGQRVVDALRYPLRERRVLRDDAHTERAPNPVSADRGGVFSAGLAVRCWSGKKRPLERVLGAGRSFTR